MKTTEYFDIRNWFPDRNTSIILLVSSVIFSVVWCIIIFFALPNSLRQMPGSLYLLAAFCALSGIAYGSFFTSFITALRAGASMLGIDTPLKLSADRTILVALTLFALHLGCLFLLSQMQLWKPIGPWYLGLLPAIWS
jgi:hypothetical protein